ncbi:hypothetical protein ACFXJ8_12005 [Nonomuraea sp. NPDC059194]
MNDDEAFAFLETCTETEMRDMLSFLHGYEPKGFMRAVEMIKRDRQAGAA